MSYTIVLDNTKLQIRATIGSEEEMKVFIEALTKQSFGVRELQTLPVKPEEKTND